MKIHKKPLGIILHFKEKIISNLKINKRKRYKNETEIVLRYKI